MYYNISLGLLAVIRAGGLKHSERAASCPRFLKHILRPKTSHLDRATENAGVEKVAPDDRGGKRRSGDSDQ